MEACFLNGVTSRGGQGLPPTRVGIGEVTYWLAEAGLQNLSRSRDFFIVIAGVEPVEMWMGISVGPYDHSRFPHLPEVCDG